VAATRRSGRLAQSWLVLVLAAVFGTALAAVQVTLSDGIAANRRAETLARVPELVRIEGGGEGTPVKIESGVLRIHKDGKSSTYPLFRVSRDGRLAGWVVKAHGQGYADRIEVLIGLDPAAEVFTGLFVLEQKETPGLGNKITFADWRQQFVGRRTAAPLRVEKGADRSPGTIDAITGATISSRSVTAIVNRAAGDLKGRLSPTSNPFAERP
jgi:electron transport complex protein RnfG